MTLSHRVFFFNDTATTEIYTLSLHRRSSDLTTRIVRPTSRGCPSGPITIREIMASQASQRTRAAESVDRKSTRLNSSHANISYAVFCLKKKIKHKSLYHSLTLRKLYHHTNRL